MTGKWKEKDLFKFVNDEFYGDLVKAKNPMSRWDCYSPHYSHRIEFKCRTKHYDTLLIEKGKYDAMLKESKKHLDIPMFIVSTPNGVYRFNLLKMDIAWEVNSKNPATTYFGDSRRRVTKEVGYMDINKAQKLL
jgi:hypothetical protein